MCSSDFTHTERQYLQQAPDLLCVLCLVKPWFERAVDGGKRPFAAALRDVSFVADEGSCAGMDARIAMCRLWDRLEGLPTEKRLKRFLLAVENEADRL